MPDIADNANETYQQNLEGHLAEQRHRNSKQEDSVSGECDLCGEEAPRLVTRKYKGKELQACPRCRDLYKLG